jgi:hypothetical protein
MPDTLTNCTLIVNDRTLSQLCDYGEIEALKQLQCIHSVGITDLRNKLFMASLTFNSVSVEELPLSLSKDRRLLLWIHL